ncbi:hypothetical protein [Cytophaga sp. FL35]|uniref:hypothetical protein n=1 Tax=Cytophaga sp. FL35 TaxID=1904456 RepID=UPI001653583E|nr:hypothetical protein [Cytophaga sp. FL35]MBC6999861.1 hypothetical protein [Cytophaga sp. FL35]
MESQDNLALHLGLILKYNDKSIEIYKLIHDQLSDETDAELTYQKYRAREIFSMELKTSLEFAGINATIGDDLEYHKPEVIEVNGDLIKKGVEYDRLTADQCAMALTHADLPFAVSTILTNQLTTLRNDVGESTEHL